MRKALLVLLAASFLSIGCLANPAWARADDSRAAARDGSAPASAVQRTPDKSDLVEHKYYTNQNGQRIHAPAHTLSGSVPPGASAQCRDGSYSFSTHRRGTCSRHGGVAQWLGLAK